MTYISSSWTIKDICTYIIKQLQLTIHNNHIHGNSIDVCSRLSGKKPYASHRDACKLVCVHMHNAKKNKDEEQILRNVLRNDIPEKRRRVRWETS